MIGRIRATHCSGHAEEDITRSSICSCELVWRQIAGPPVGNRHWSKRLAEATRRLLRSCSGLGLRWMVCLVVVQRWMPQFKDIIILLLIYCWQLMRISVPDVQSLVPPPAKDMEGMLTSCLTKPRVAVVQGGKRQLKGASRNDRVASCRQS